MEIKNENELIEIIKNKSLEEIKSNFREYQITPTKFNYYNNVLIYLIKNFVSFEIIEYFVKQRQKVSNQLLLNNTEALFCSIDYFEFDIANLLLRYGANIGNKNAKSENIIEYLLRVDRLHEDKLSFILTAKKDFSLLTNKILFELFGYYRYKSLLDVILNFKFTVNKESIIDTLVMAKTGIAMTDNELQEYIYGHLNTIINFNIKNENGSTLFLHTVMNHNSFDLIRKIVSYSKKNSIVLNLNEQNNKGFYPLLVKQDVLYYFEYLELLIGYARDNKIVLEMNRKDKTGDNALFNLIRYAYEYKCLFFPKDAFNKDELYAAVNLLMNYAKETNYILDLNEKDSEGNSLLLYIICKTNYIHWCVKRELVQLIIDYASEHNIILELGGKNKKDEIVILEAAEDYEILKLLIEYAEKFNIVPEIFEYGNSLLYKGIVNNHENIIRLVVETAQNNNMILDFNEKLGKDGNSILQDLMHCNGIELFQLILNYVKSQNIKLELNEKNKCGNYPLLMAIQNKSIEKVQFLMEYAHANNIILEMNQQDHCGNYPLLAAMDDNDHCFKIVQLLMNHAKENNIILKINERDKDGNTPLLKAIIRGNAEVLRLLEEYAKENNMDIEVKSKNNKGNSPLLEGSGNTEILQWLIHYTKENNITLDVNEKNNHGDYPLLKLHGNDVCFNMLVDLAKENNVALEINEKNSHGDYPVLTMAEYDQCFSVLVKYAKENNITLIINDKNNDGEYPLLKGIENHEFIKLLIEYASETSIPLELNDKNKNEQNLLTKVCDISAFESLRLLIEYAQENNILLDINRRDKERRTLVFKIIEYFNERHCKNKRKREQRKMAKVKTVQLLMDYAHNNGITINLSEKINPYTVGPHTIVEYAICHGNVDIFKLLIDYAEKEGMILSLLNDNYSDHILQQYNLLLYALHHGKSAQIIKVIVEVAQKNNIKYDIFERNGMIITNGIKFKDAEIIQMIIQHANDSYVVFRKYELNISLLYACKIDGPESEKIVKLIIEYAKKANTILDVDHYISECSPFVNAIHHGNFNVVQLLSDYSRQYHITFDLDTINPFTNYPLFQHKDIKVTQWLIDYAKENGIVININLRNNKNRCCLTYQIKKKNFEMVQLLIQYAKENHIKLDLNTSDYDGNYPFLQAMRVGNKKMIQLLLDYANENNMIIEINRGNSMGCFPLFYAIRGNNMDVVQLLLDYATTHHIVLDVDRLECYNGHFVLYPDQKDKIKSNTKEITEIILDYKKKLNN